MSLNDHVRATKICAQLYMVFTSPENEIVGKEPSVVFLCAAWNASYSCSSFEDMLLLLICLWGFGQFSFGPFTFWLQQKLWIVSPMITFCQFGNCKSTCSMVCRIKHHWSGLNAHEPPQCNGKRMFCNLQENRKDNIQTVIPEGNVFHQDPEGCTGLFSQSTAIIYSEKNATSTEKADRWTDMIHRGLAFLTSVSFNLIHSFSVLFCLWLDSWKT